MTKMTNCRHCNNECPLLDKRHGNRERKYCSVLCAKQGQIKKRTLVKCCSCNSPLNFTERYIENLLKKFSNVYCSKKCASDAKKIIAKKHCVRCSLEFIRENSKIKNQNYCSRQCSSNHVKEKHEKFKKTNEYKIILRKKAIDYYNKKVIKKDGCWSWSGFKDKDGYAMFRIDYINFKAHRFSWEIHNGPIPKRLLVLHHCDNPECTSPKCLFLGDTKANVDDKISKGRHLFGTNHPNSVLTIDKVREIKLLLKSKEISKKEISIQFNISIGTVTDIASGKTWKHIEIV